MRRQPPAWLLVAGAALALRLWLIFRYPALFGGDSVVRLANLDRIFLSYQLPTLQALLHGLSHCATEVVWFRLWMAGIAAAASVGFLLFARQYLERKPALAAALFFATNPFLAAYSTVPYQEMLMLGALSFAAAFRLQERTRSASAALGVACWTRYEAWLACPVLFLADVRAGGFTPRVIGLSLLRWGWAPLLWMVLHAGLTPAGGYAVEALWNPERFWRWIYLGWITVQNGWMLLPFAVVGAFVVWERRLWRIPRYQALGLFFALFLAAILFSSHGERDQPDRFVTAREAHLLLAGIALLAGLGWSRLPRRRTLAALVVAIQIVAADRFVARETADPKVRLAYEAAQHLRTAAGPSDTVLVLARPVPEALLARFLATAERQGGAEERRHAVRTLLELDTTPPDSQRIRVQAGALRERWFSLSSFPRDLIPGQKPLPAEIRPDWVLRWSDFEPTNAVEQRWAEKTASLEPAAVLGAGEIGLAIYRPSY